jgi:hypothetical protein
MKNFKTAFLLSAFVLLAIMVKAQNGNYFIKMDGTKVNIHGEELYDDGKTIQYKNERNKNENESIKNIKIMILGGSILINIPINPKRNFRSLQYIVAFNDKYVLTGKLYSSGDHLNILDREFNFVNTDEIKFVNGTTNKVSEKNKQIYKENVLKYFKDCANLNEAIYKNIEKYTTFYDGINYYNCNNAPDLFTNKTVKSSEVNQDLVKVVEKKDFYVTTTGEKIEVPSNYYIVEFAKYFSYNLDGNIFKTVNVLGETIKYLLLDNKLYAPIKVSDTKYHVVEIKAFNNNFVLFVKYPTSIHWANQKFKIGVYDRKSNSVIEEVEGGGNLDPLLDKYFKDCTDLKNIIDDNLKNHRKSTFGFTYYNCNKAKELIEGIKFE